MNILTNDCEIFASSNDAEFPVTNVLESNQGCWMSTGSFPQSIWIKFGRKVNLSRIDVSCFRINHFVVAGFRTGVLESVNETNILGEKRFMNDKGLQRISFDVDTTVSRIQLQIKSGFDDFVAIKSIILWSETEKANAEKKDNLTAKLPSGRGVSKNTKKDVEMFKGGSVKPKHSILSR
eukprot:TRINITY_DN6599_c0_g2_i1.p1 TRINITY_DN6599_c0_g2~~TRINITY_DN6599_c0_g2_i1.p1  ORF type:complete len:179 (+),score=28.65 TRINITY_DN6599_c0_g2_i1:170-706(+)